MSNFILWPQPPPPPPPSPSPPPYILLYINVRPPKLPTVPLAFSLISCPPPPPHTHTNGMSGSANAYPPYLFPSLCPCLFTHLDDELLSFWREMHGFRHVDVRLGAGCVQGSEFLRELPFLDSGRFVGVLCQHKAARCSSVVRASARDEMDRRIDHSTCTYWTISRSSQWSTTGVRTNAVVYTILCVGWCI